MLFLLIFLIICLSLIRWLIICFFFIVSLLWLYPFVEVRALTINSTFILNYLYLLNTTLFKLLSPLSHLAELIVVLNNLIVFITFTIIIISIHFLHTKPIMIILLTLILNLQQYLLLIQLHPQQMLLQLLQPLTLIQSIITITINMTTILNVLSWWKCQTQYLVLYLLYYIQ